MFKYRVIEGHTAGKHVLVTGGVHGDEFEPMEAIRQLMRTIAPERLRGRVTFVPVVNEPAFQRGSRTAEDGLDLARTCPGRPDGSITERIADRLSALIRSADAYVDLHTGGTRLNVLPLCGYVLHPDRSILDQQRTMARAFGLPIIWGTDPTLEGRSLSVARDARIPAIYAEYHGAAQCDVAGVAAYVAGVQRVLRELGMVDAAPPLPSTPPLVVEDDRPGSGHMQVNHPAPRDGFFQPSVELGQHVASGDLLGTIVDPLGDERAEVRAAYGGIVIVLHTFARIDAGTSVAVVLDTSRKTIAGGPSR